MREKSEKDEKYRLGRHWQTIQRSLFPEWEREADGKIVEEERLRRSDIALMPAASYAASARS